MIKHKPFYSLLFALFFFILCDAQLKITRPVGTHEGDNIRCGIQDKAGNFWFGTSGEGVYRYDGRSFTNYITKDGLNNDLVWSILEDKNGNIWFGTDSGICRYDPSGKHTDGKIFTPVPIVVNNSNNPLSFSSPNNNLSSKTAVYSIMQDRSGK